MIESVLLIGSSNQIKFKLLKILNINYYSCKYIVGCVILKGNIECFDSSFEGI